MIKKLGMLYKYIKIINEAGMDMLIEAAKDISGKKKFLKEAVEEETSITPTETEELYKQFDEAVYMANRAKECGYAT